MDAIVRRRALLAAAKVALSLTVLGCSSGSEDSTAEDDTSAEALRHKDAGCSAHHTPACDVPEIGADASVSKSGIACCKSLIQSEMVDAGFGMGQLPASAKKDPDVLSCCSAVKAQGIGQFQSLYETAMACCQLTGDFSNPACTPWGPPMPPAMREGFALPEVA